MNKADEFLGLLKDINEVTAYIYYPDKTRKDVKKIIKNIKRKVKNDGINSIMK